MGADSNLFLNMDDSLVLYAASSCAASSLAVLLFDGGAMAVDPHIPQDREDTHFSGVFSTSREVHQFGKG